jgi:hypothetical protein
MRVKAGAPRAALSRDPLPAQESLAPQALSLLGFLVGLIRKNVASIRAPNPM